MGVYIKGIGIPQNCDECPLNSTCGYSLHMPLYHTEKRHDDCPLIEVSEPHGRLIDADKLKETLDYYIREAGWSDEINKALSWVKDEFIYSEPTVIPTSEEC